MNQFKDILLKLHGENKKMLRWLYVDKQIHIESVSSSEQPIEDEKLFSYHGLRFRFAGTGMRQPERMNLFIFLPRELPGTDELYPDVSQEDYLLRILSPGINGLSREMENDHKDAREKAKFECQTADSRILRRSGLIYDDDGQCFVLRILFQMPLINGTGINAKSGLRALRSLLDTVEQLLNSLDWENFKEHVAVYRRQTEILQWMLSHQKVAFVANGSILPRQADSDLPLPDAVPFEAPPSLLETLTLSDGFQISGMAIPRGVTVITGGGYSGKSTLLDALEQGIYRHIPGDGREYVLSLPGSAKIYAEDGRPVHHMDLSLFFHGQNPGISFENFSTAHASGSVSQAANILEAVYAGCDLLLIDEDTSATNFMIRDSFIRRLVKKEPIIPFTDRVRDLWELRGISTILVIGGSGEYLRYADHCLLMEDYRIRDVTGPAKELAAEMPVSDTCPAKELPMLLQRFFRCPDSTLPFRISQCVSVDQAHYIQVDEYTSDVTRLTALTSEDQFHTLAFLLEHSLGNPSGDVCECSALAAELTAQLFRPEIIDKIQGSHYQFTLWLEEIRPMDFLAALFRMRGIEIF